MFRIAGWFYIFVVLYTVFSIVTDMQSVGMLTHDTKTMIVESIFFTVFMFVYSVARLNLKRPCKPTKV